MTRLISLRWTGRRANGIDRVCLEYLHHYRERAQAVVQHRGVVLVLSPTASRRLFVSLADECTTGARRRMVGHIAEALLNRCRPVPGSLYLNVSHTDFDLLAHTRWIERHALRAVYLIHDLIPILHPEYCRPHAVNRHRGRVDAALRHGAGIIVTSGAVFEDLMKHCDYTDVTSPSVTIAPLAGARLPMVAKAAAPATPYFLCVGTIERRKNHELLLKVWERLHAREDAAPVKLVIVGSWGSGSAQVRSGLQATRMMDGSIEVLEDCGDAQLASLMVGARALLMPSFSEGFGLPVAEALRLGVPVIASDLPCFREIGQGLPCLLDPNDIDAWYARIAAFDCAAAARQRRIDALMTYCPPTWKEHFECVDPWMATLPHERWAIGLNELTHAVAARAGGRASSMGA